SNKKAVWVRKCFAFPHGVRLLTSSAPACLAFRRMKALTLTACAMYSWLVRIKWGGWLLLWAIVTWTGGQLGQTSWMWMWKSPLAIPSIGLLGLAVRRNAPLRLCQKRKTMMVT